MKKLILFVCAVMLFLPAVHAEDPSTEETTIIREGMGLPEFKIKMTDGSVINSSDLSGKVVYISFWSTWCPSCRQTMERFPGEIVERYDGKDFVFIPISRGERPAKVKEFMSDMNYTFPAGLDEDKSVYLLFASNYVPRNFVVDREGNVVLSSVGYSEEKFDEIIAALDGLFE